ncbi:pyruvate dehydrogenase E1 component subunit alpha [Actinoplanes sp. OR16]|uniref:thiamine pyrophosphate-dependent enzyme n=1 Tax=Actinoplanes sp. OR16 TaxID=946334 RepID=UPI000F6DF559|nr:thiamine pyrophosphate-dependent enzyme [Actinoplanes sp. OR16]BBH68658.1 pyruvate dehydrogenase E1 component subunit alpha [Actinoplanes sp. OR16]
MTRDAAHLLPSAEPVTLIDPDGHPVPQVGHSMPDPQALVRAYAALITARRFNDQANALVRQGRLAVYPSSHGQEACQVACVQVLGDGDWLFPTYRDTAAIVTRGVDPVQALTLLRGDWHSGYDPLQTRVAPQATPLATHLLHAVGVAHAARLRGEDTVVMAVCGDGATSEGDFHEALNFAAVFRTPVVFLVQNNEYAISVPLARQTAAPSLAHKGIGYGVKGERVDGNDVAALLRVLGDAVDRARAGEGPQLVEAHTYRVQAHTNADDPGRYRSEDEVAPWLGRDPLVRLEAYLGITKLINETDRSRFVEHAEALAARMREGLGEEPVADYRELFAYVYAEPTPQLREQQSMVADEMAREGTA